MSYLRESVKSVLKISGLLPLCKYVRDEFWRRHRIRLAAKQGWTDKFPTPSGDLLDLIVGGPDPYGYYYGSDLAINNMLRILSECSISPNSFKKILDFGCGCGRTLRKWVNYPFQVYGTDYNPQLTAFSEKAFPFARISTNNLFPPLEYPDNEFDFVYLLSVFTHLSLDTTQQWMREFHRILKPGGYLLFTMQGEYFMENRSFITQDMKDQMHENGMLLVKENQEGKNDCGLFCTYDFVLEHVVTEEWELVKFFDHGAKSVCDQDVYMLRKR